MRRLVLRLGLASAALAAGACGGDGPPAITDPTDDADLAVGVYALLTINGQPLPFLLDQEGSDLLEITAGTVSLELNRSFSDVTTYRLTLSGVVTTETDGATGTWDLAGNTVFLTPTGLTAYSMLWDRADRLTQVFEGFTLVYVRPPG